MSQKVLARLQAELGDAVLETHSQFGDDTAVVVPARWREVARFLRDDPRCDMDMFVDLTAVDYRRRRRPRFEIVLHVRSLERAHRVRVKARIGRDDAAAGSAGEDDDDDLREDECVRIDSLVDVWAGANWFERECYDMFGVEFVGHPDLRRILMYEEFVGYPLRKDYAAGRTQPLVEYRKELGKLPPFGPDEGMSFGRQTHDVFPRGQFSDIDDTHAPASARDAAARPDAAASRATAASWAPTGTARGGDRRP